MGVYFVFSLRLMCMHGVGVGVDFRIPKSRLPTRIHVISADQLLSRAISMPFMQQTDHTNCEWQREERKVKQENMHVR